MPEPVEIPLRGGYVALVDEEDYQYIEVYPWRAVQRGDGMIAQALVPKWLWAQGTPRRIQMHRVIVQPPEGYRVVHRNGNGLDNRRANLQIPHFLEKDGYAWDIGAGAWRWFVGPEWDGPDIQPDSGYAGDETDAALERDRALVTQLGLEGARGMTNHSETTLRRLLGLDGPSGEMGQPPEPGDEQVETNEE